MNTSYPMVNISLKTLIRECANDPRLQQDIFQDFSLMNRENVHEVFKYKKFNYDFTDYVTCYNDGEHVIGYIRPSYDEFVYAIAKFLGASITSTKDEEEVDRRLQERLERLKAVSSEMELLKEFPYIHQDLVQGRRYIQDLKRMRRLSPVNEDRYEEEEHYYYSCALKQRFDRFMATQIELYSRFVNQRKEYKSQIETKSHNRYIRKHFNKDKMAMLVVHEYLKICEGTQDIETLKKYITCIEKYFASDYDKRVQIHLDDQSIVNYYNIVVRYNGIKAKMKKEERTIEWELVPKGRDFQRVSKPLSSNPRPEIYSIEELERLRAKGRQKQDFYENSSYLVKVVGLAKYRGYVGYIYPNGEVLLDREYNEDSPRTAYSNAIYNIKAVDFESLSHLDKTILRNHPNVKRIVHSKNWETRARKIMEKETSKENREEAIQLVKRLRNEKE